MGDLFKIGALWKKTGAKGTFYGGTLDAERAKSAMADGKTKLFLFPVKNKKNDKQPDVELFLAAPRERNDASGENDF